MTEQDPAEILRKKLAREIRAREVAEQLLEDRSDELYNSLLEIQDNEDLLKKALNSMQEGLLMLNDRYEVILFNEKLRTIYPEWSHCFHQGIRIRQLFGLFTQHPALETLNSNNNPTTTFEVNLTDGRVIAISATLSDDGTLASTHKDVTTIKASFQEQQRLLIKLMQAQRMDSIGKMAGSIAHDFNNIIAAIKGYAGFLEEDIPDDPKLNNSVSKIIQAATKAEDLVQHILDYGQPDKITFEAIEVQPLLNDSINLVQATLPERIRITHQPNQYPGYFSGSATQLSQVVMNLLTNAVQAIGDGAGHIRVKWDRHNKLDLNQPNYALTGFNTRETGMIVAGLHIFSSPCIRLSIMDDGCGMNRHTMEHMFDLFFSTKAEREGRGMGMYNVMRLITEHSGGIRIHSKPNAGTLCEVVIPAAQAPELIQPEQAQITINQKSGVLLVDDEQDAGHVLSQALHRAGITTQFFTQGAQALQAFKEKPEHWKVIISDQMMPDMRGTQLLKQLRDEGHQVPFIIYSGHIMDDEYARHVTLANHVFKKPMDIKTLIKTVKQYL